MASITCNGCETGTSGTVEVIFAWSDAHKCPPKGGPVAAPAVRSTPAKAKSTSQPKAKRGKV